MLALTLALTLTTLAALACKSAGSTPTAAYKAAYAAVKNKDAAAFRKIITKKSAEALDEAAKKSNKSSDDFIKDIMNDAKLAKTDESKDEKITGDTATLQVKTEKDDWETVNLVKEDGEWKMKLE
jgi:hypothetical protein